MSIFDLCMASIPEDEGYHAPTVRCPIGDPIGCIPRSSSSAMGHAVTAGTAAALAQRAMQDVGPSSYRPRTMRGRPRCAHCGNRRVTFADRCSARRCREMP